MKIYAVYAKVILTDQPEWLDEFRKKYDKPYDFHLTLKQSATIEPEQLSEIKEAISAIVRNFYVPDHVLKLNFDELAFDWDDYDNAGFIYVFSKQRNNLVDDLQREIRTKLQEYSNYLNPESRTYEYDFNPHITIARELDKNTLEAVREELRKGIQCRGEVKEIVLSCVEEITPKASTDPANLTIFTLGGDVKNF